MTSLIYTNAGLIFCTFEKKIVLIIYKYEFSPYGTYFTISLAYFVQNLYPGPPSREANVS